MFVPFTCLRISVESRHVNLLSFHAGSVAFNITRDCFSFAKLLLEGREEGFTLLEIPTPTSVIGD